MLSSETATVPSNTGLREGLKVAALLLVERDPPEIRDDLLHFALQYLIKSQPYWERLRSLRRD